ncbi:hypothetical protein [Phaeodactylibacter luteus]|uniref:Uncharacterized protein n=1 Tax=Phaeodactylibacter luteus TaxID=1564516 RepID=A0A5C6RPH5_9BACT|nr:hypothetical protein [Phaeodactylibacter luteus]TXB63580.1 hypothetical protein FRY97_08625 [Phaeodactylibacter luteus]
MSKIVLYLGILTIGAPLLFQPGSTAHSAPMRLLYLDTLPLGDQGFGEEEEIAPSRPAAPKPPKARVIPVRPVRVDSTAFGAQGLPNGFTGYRIQVLRIGRQLPAGHSLFAQHGQVVEEKLPGGEWAYTLGRFAERADALSFFKQFLQAAYPEGEVIKYENGARAGRP